MHKTPDARIQQHNRALIAGSPDGTPDQRDDTRRVGEPAHNGRGKPPREPARKARGKPPLELERSILDKPQLAAVRRRRARADNDAPTKC